MAKPPPEKQMIWPAESAARIAILLIPPIAWALWYCVLMHVARLNDRETGQIGKWMDMLPVGQSRGPTNP